MNGYTSIFENKQPTFAEFLWREARLFGPLIHMRDSSLDASIRLCDDEYFEKSFEERQLPKARAELARYEAMTIAEATRYCAKLLKEAQQRHEESRLKAIALKVRLKKTLAEAHAWNPPTLDHEGLKEQMIKDLEETIERDCKMWDPPVEAQYEPITFLKESIDSEKRRITRYEKDIAEQKRSKRLDANQWILQLHASVPCPTGKPK